MSSSLDLNYRDAGVDIDFAANCLLEIDHTRARGNEVIKSPNDFAGLFSLKELCTRYDDPVLVSSTDGVGTKLLVAILCDRFDGLGQDLVAMCVNDIATKGAEPLFFLDYFACGNIKSVPFVKLINGMVIACDEINCALIGGETAEMPTLYSNKHFDLAGFGVGVAERKHLLGVERVNEGDILLGIASSGLHANGYALVRKIIFDKLGHRPNDVLWQTERSVRTVADELLSPTKIYVNPIKEMMKQGIVPSAIAHITGGGITENLPRVIPAHYACDVDLRDVAIPRIFSYLMEHGPVSREEMLRTFNMGLGLVVVVKPEQKNQVSAIFKSHGETVFEIGAVIPFNGGPRCRVTQ